MGSAKDIAKDFTITSLLNESTLTQRNYPVAEIELARIEDHPNNNVYSMDESAIFKLATSIKEQGLTDLPLVRKTESGSFQMISGHRRKAAYTLLAQEDDSFGKIPCRIIEGVSDEQAVMLLHAANYFTRTLTMTERAAATRALGVVVEQRRSEDPSLVGVRTEDIKATIIRQEALAELIETKLIDAWRAKAEAGYMSASCIEEVACLCESDQVDLYDNLPSGAVSKSTVSRYIEDALSERAAEATELARERELALILNESFHPQTDMRLKMAITSIRNYLSDPPSGTQNPDLKASSLLRCLSDHLPKQTTKSSKKATERLRHSD